MKTFSLVVSVLAAVLLAAITLPATAAAPPAPDDIWITQVGSACMGELALIDVHWSPELFQYTYIVTVDLGSASWSIYNANSPQLFEVPTPSDVTITVEACIGSECSGISETFWIHGDPNCMVR